MSRTAVLRERRMQTFHDVPGHWHRRRHPDGLRRPPRLSLSGTRCRLAGGPDVLPYAAFLRLMNPLSVRRTRSSSCDRVPFIELQAPHSNWRLLM